MKTFLFLALSACMIGCKANAPANKGVHFTPKRDCLPSFEWDENQGRCMVTITFTTPSPVSCSNISDQQQAMRCGYQP